MSSSLVLWAELVAKSENSDVFADGCPLSHKISILDNNLSIYLKLGTS